MSRLITITATTKISHEDDANEVAAGLAEEVVRVLERADYQPINDPEIRIDRYTVVKPPRNLALTESRIKATVQVWQ
jgi:hypothetical protein